MHSARPAQADEVFAGRRMLLGLAWKWKRGSRVGDLAPKLVQGFKGA